MALARVRPADCRLVHGMALAAVGFDAFTSGPHHHETGDGSASWTVCQIMSFVVDELIRIGFGAWAAIGLSLFDELMTASAFILGGAIWLNRGRWLHAQGDLRRAVQRGFIGEYAWQSLFVALVAFAAAVPLLVIVVEGVFVLPQYDQWLRDSAVEAPWWFGLLADTYRRTVTLGLVLAIPFGLYLGLAQGRLMRLHAVGGQIPVR